MMVNNGTMRSRRMAGTPKIRKPSVRIQKIRKPSGSKRYENLLDPKDGGKLTDHPLTKDAASNAKGERKAGDVRRRCHVRAAWMMGFAPPNPTTQYNSIIDLLDHYLSYAISKPSWRGNDSDAAPLPTLPRIIKGITPALCPGVCKFIVLVRMTKDCSARIESL